MDLSGRSLGKYQLIARVGQGGMAHVYKAVQPTIERAVAVKVLHSHLAEDADFVARFKREARSLGQLRHPHIVNVIDFDVDDGWYFMVMDFIEGPTLHDVLAKRGILPVDEALRLAEQLAGALDYAHQNGAIHRDMKPANVMFRDAAATQPVITDFGIAKLLDNKTMTMSGSIVGTPTYMSPEAAQGVKVDGRSDIYSLGVILYQMVTGQPPYSGETPLSVIMKHMTEPLPPAVSLNPALPPPVDLLLDKALAKAPENRFQTAAEFSAALLRANSRAAAVPPASSPQPATATAAQSPESPRVVSPERLPAPVTPAPAAETAVRKRPLPLLIAAVVVLALSIGGFFWLGNGADDVDPVETPAAVADDAEPTNRPTDQPTNQPANRPAGQPTTFGFLRFADADGSGERAFTLALDGVPAPPTNQRYELWLMRGGQGPPLSVGLLDWVNGRINFSGEVAEADARAVTGLIISIEPEFDDNPAMSATVAFGGDVENGDLSRIEVIGRE